MLSPWIRRALIAGGFGIGHKGRIPSEVAPVVPYGDVRHITSPDLEAEKTDIESNTQGSITELRRGSSSSKPDRDSNASLEPITLEDTPYFHFDIVAAVKAAEGNALQEAVASPSVDVDVESISSGKQPIRD